MAVYFIRAGEAGPVKIGKAKNPARRRATFQTAHYEHLLLVRTAPGYTAEEAWLRESYRHLHIRGEWHHWCDSMLQVEIPALPALLPAVRPAKTYVTRPLVNRDCLIELPEPFGWKVPWYPVDFTEPAYFWAQALHRWMIEHQHTPQSLCGRLGVLPKTVGGWVGWGNFPQRVPAQRLLAESENVLLASMRQLRPLMAAA